MTELLAKSKGRQAKELAMGRKKQARLLVKLRAMRKSLPSLDQMLRRGNKSRASRRYLK